MDSCVTATAHLATLVMDHHLNCLCVIVDSVELRRRVNFMEGKTLESVLSAEQFQAKGRCYD